MRIRTGVPAGSAGAALALLLLTVIAAHARADAVAVHAGWLLADPAAAPRREVTVTIGDGRVRGIEDGYRDSVDGETVIDLRDRYVLPGLIDLHVHLTTPAAPGGDLRQVTQTSADLALTALMLGQRNLRAGFTTVVDLGTGRAAHDEAIYALRDAIAAGRVTGPRIVAAGSPISPTGASRTGAYRPEIDAAMAPPGVCDGADDCRRAVRELIAGGADIVNVYNSGSLNDPYIAAQTFTDAEFRAIVETAHLLGRRVIADGHTAAGINAALRAGADIVDTAPWPDEESWRLMRKTGAVFVPHLFAFESAVGDEPAALDSGTMHWIPSPIMRRLFRIKREPYSAERAYREGITLAFGSDTGVIVHGTNAGEFAELVRVGLSPAEAIATATRNAAAALGLDREIGSLEPGKAADLIAVDSDPFADVRALERVVFVMRAGRVVRND